MIFRAIFRTLFFCLFSFTAIQAQTIIHGKVTDGRTGTGLAGAILTVVNSNKGTVTDLDGNYSIAIPQSATLEVYYTGYTTQRIEPTGASEINVTLVESTTAIDQVVVIGSRKSARVLMETPVPIDVINAKQVSSNTARMDLTSILNYATPSLNYNKQSGSDGADHIDLATLRGLGPDQTLVLINGKRRHQTAFVSVFGTRGRGNSGTDLNAFPSAAIDRVEILRDGAAAQYGSDAIAGVMNIILKKNKGFSANIGYSGYYDSKYNPAFESELKQYIHENKFDGNNLAIDANYGINIGKKGGFLNVTLNHLRTAKTYRQVSDTSNLFTNDDALPFGIYRRAQGDGSLNLFGAMYNFDLPISENMSFYSFGGLNNKLSDAYAFTRNFSQRPGRFVTDKNGNIVNKDGFIFSTPDGEQYFNPHIQSRVNDQSIAFGLKGTMCADWKYDLSNVLGRNDFHFYGDKTVNASTGDINKNHFDDGGFTFLQNTTNFGISKQLNSKLHLGTGAELRLENYELYAGELASYANIDTSLGKASGSQGFPGYQPSDEVKSTRSALGAFLDLEYDVTKRWLLNGAVRVENYSDFGFTHNYKLATRYKLADNFNLRASASTGFRAPSLQQINFSSTFTTVQGGQISEVKIAPNQNAITKAAGIEDLKEERSVNLNAGFTYRPMSSISITVDAYRVQVKDRIVLSGQFSADDTSLNPDLTKKLKELNVSLAQFFANAVNTSNNGVDIVVDHTKKKENSYYKVLLAANLQKMTLDKINVPTKLNDTKDHRDNFLSTREQKFILASAPPSKLSLNLEYGIKKFNAGIRLSRFGKVILQGYGEDGLGINPTVPTDADENVKVADEYVYAAKNVLDLYLGYKITKSIQFNLGVDNLLNIHPDFGAIRTAKNWAYNNESGGAWDAVQMGSNGMRIFGRLGFNF